MWHYSDPRLNPKYNKPKEDDQFIMKKALQIICSLKFDENGVCTVEEYKGLTQSQIAHVALMSTKDFAYNVPLYKQD
jgi:hypothetical protein